MADINDKNADEMAKHLRALSAPFHPDAVKWKPSMVKNGRALAMAYIDARLVMDRLDKVAGVADWQDEYDVLPDGGVVCRLKVRIAGEWITKADVGSPSEQPDGGDRMKAAFSDALKRAAVKFGVGRYLYRLPSQWVDYDPVKKQITRKPTLPAWAVPKNADPDELVPDEPEEPTPAKAAAATARPKPAAPANNEMLRVALAAQIGAAGNRDQLKAVWDEYEAALNAGNLGPADKAALVPAFATKGATFPKPAEKPVAAK